MIHPNNPRAACLSDTLWGRWYTADVQVSRVVRGVVAGVVPKLIPPGGVYHCFGGKAAYGPGWGLDGESAVSSGIR